MPSADSKAKPDMRWWGNVSPTATHYWYRKRREVARLLTQHVPLSPAARIADLGTGRGGDILLLAGTYPEAEIVGIDLDQDDLDAAAQRFGELPRVSLECADLRERLPFEDGSLDLAHCSEVLEHLPQPEGLLAEVRRVLKPKGHFLITTPNEPNILQKRFWTRRGRQAEKGGDAARSPAGVRQDAELYAHISLGTVAEWDTSLSTAGFQLVDFGRGALVYGGRQWLDREDALAMFFATEALIDIAPRKLTRRLSDQCIGLYQRA